MTNTTELRAKIASAINSVSAENGSNTPDFILAEYLTDCLAAFDKASRERERWYGKELSIAGIPSAPVVQPKHYLPGMGEESRRLHREYNALVEAQRNGAKNDADVRKLTDECAAKGIILVPGGENL